MGGCETPMRAPRDSTAFGSNSTGFGSYLSGSGTSKVGFGDKNLHYFQNLQTLACNILCTHLLSGVCSDQPKKNLGH